MKENVTETVSTPKVVNIPNAKPAAKKMREIIIETDGNNIHLKKADVSGSIELIAILQSLTNYLNNKRAEKKIT